MAAPKGNKFAEGLTNSGRPPIYSDPQVLHDRIVAYFDYIQGKYHTEIIEVNGKEKEVKVWDREPEPLTITGLTLYLGFADKSTLYDYVRNKEFSHSIKRALTFVEKHYEEMLLSKASTGAIFALKNMDWNDRQQIEQTNLNHTIKELNYEDVHGDNGN